MCCGKSCGSGPSGCPSGAGDRGDCFLGRDLPVSGQSGCPWQAAGDDPGLPAQAGGIFPLSAPGQAGHGADAGGLAALPAEGGLLPGTVNTHISAANGLLAFLGRRDLQLIGQLDTGEEIQPELTRAEYLRLLTTARTQGRERTYLLVKTFALTGLRVGELDQMTAEAVAEGRVSVAEGGRRREVPIPACLQRELESYLHRTGITPGPVFLTRSGRPMRRTQVSGEIRTLCRDARVDAEKSNPRCLRRLYQATQEQIRADVLSLAEQAHEQLLDAEQRTVGWENGG